MGRGEPGDIDAGGKRAPKRRVRKRRRKRKQPGKIQPEREAYLRRMRAALLQVMEKKKVGAGKRDLRVEMQRIY